MRKNLLFTIQLKSDRFRQVLTSAMSKPLTLVLLIGLLSSCNQPSPVINIGVLRDSQSRNGEPTVQAVKLAVEQVNEDGGLLVEGTRYRVQLVILDSGNTPQQAIKAAQKLIADKVVGIIGPNTSRTTLPVSGLVESVQLPLITPIATHEDITKNHNYVFRTAFSDNLQGQAMGVFAREKLEAKTASALFDVSDEYSQGLFINFKTAFEKNGSKVVSVEKFVTGETDFSTLVQNLSLTMPDVIYLPGNSKTVDPQAKQLRQAGLTSVFLGGDSWNQKTISNAPEFEGAYFTDHWHAKVNQQNVESKLYFDQFQTRYKEVPNIVSMLAFDSINLLFDAIRKSSLDGKSIQSQLTQTTNFGGVTGRISFTRHGETEKPVYILHVKDGEIQLAEEVYP